MTQVVGGATEQELREELAQIRSELRELNKVGMALMSERDPEKLLGLILTQARALTTSDAGSLYLVEENGAWKKDNSESSSETLVKDRTKTSLSGSCTKPPEAAYRKVADQGKERLRSKASKDLQALLSRLQKKKGVESAELQ